MKKLLSIVILTCGLMLSGCLESAPKCNDETVVSLVKEIITDDEWFFVENGFTKQSLMSLMMTMNGMTFSQMAAVSEHNGIYKGLMFDLRDYANEVPYISLEDFMTDSVDKQSKSSYCSATLKIEYPEMSQEMRRKYKDSLKGPIFDGGIATREVAYSARYTDDGKKIYVELLED